MPLNFQDQKKLDDFWEFCLKNQYFNLGYPQSADFDYTELNKFLRFSLNNLGDWAKSCNYVLNSFEFEKETIEYFADLYKIPFSQSWGYVTNGGTEGNLFGCYLARDLFPTGVMYYSKDTHYSIAKNIKLLRIDARMVESLPNGEIDYDDLITKIRRDKTQHPLILANIGSTVRGAIDNIEIIQSRIAQLGIDRKDYYIHADAALSGMILPFVDDPQPFNFEDGSDSIAVSGSKMIGAPLPCGVVLAKKSNVERISIEIDYISSDDKTINGSRSGYSPLVLWHAIKTHSYQDWKRRIDRCLQKADEIIAGFQDAGIAAWRGKNSITVVFPKPSEWVWRKHALATSGDCAHIITSGHNNDHHERLDIALKDIIKDYQETHRLSFA